MLWNIQKSLHSTNQQDIQSEIIKILLQNRKIEHKQEFFNPPHPSTFTPRQIGINAKQINKATKRIQRAIQNREQIIVYGDYDADGICSTAIMWETLQELAKVQLSRKLNFDPTKIMPYIPDRFTDGYGMKKETISKLKANNPMLKLIITVDNGITAHEAIDYCNQQGIDVILTDHHEPPKNPPNAHATVHTTLTSGSGVVWFFCQELLSSFRAQHSQPVARKNPNKISHPEEISQEITSSHVQNDTLSLAAIGTVADLLPLTGFNRSLVSHGLLELRQTARPGLQALFHSASIQPSQIETYHIGYIISPRLNAMGRLEHALDSLRLLCTTDSYRAKQLAHHLHTTNQERQHLTREMAEHALQQAQNQSSQNIIIVGHADYPEGIIGLIAGKITEKYHKPAIAMSHGKNFSKASARSIPNYNIIEAIRTASDILDSAGGHPMAAGFSIQTQHLEQFTLQLLEHANTNISQSDLIKTLHIDTEIQLSDITTDLYQKIKQFAPFGIGNSEPIFAATRVSLQNFKAVGQQQNHLKLTVYQNSLTFSAIAFNQVYHLPNLNPGQTLDLAFSITENNWQGRTTLELKIKDLKF